MTHYFVAWARSEYPGPDSHGNTIITEHPVEWLVTNQRAHDAAPEPKASHQYRLTFWAEIPARVAVECEEDLA